MRETVDSDPVSVVNEYFSRMRARDLRVVELFHDDASLSGLGAQRCGRAAILEFYRDVINRAGPSPRRAGPLLAEGPRVAAEIYIDLPNGATIHAVDLFHIEDGLIRSLTYFIASEARTST